MSFDRPMDPTCDPEFLWSRREQMLPVDHSHWVTESDRSIVKGLRAAVAYVRAFTDDQYARLLLFGYADMRAECEERSEKRE